MNYKKVYDSLIERAKPRGLDKAKVEGYYEKHHILPRCLGGSNRESLRSLITEQLQLLEIPLRTIYSSGTTVTDRIEMRILDESNSISHLDIATEFGLKRNTVSSVCSNKPQEKFKYLESKDALELMRDTLTNQFPELFISKPLLDIRTLRCIT